MLYFPHPFTADHDGLLAIGGDLNSDRLLLAYRFGIFPWYSQSPILWWWTHPRCVLYPDELKVSKSMRSLIKKDQFKVTYNTAFDAVIKSCRNVSRPNQMGTWINSEMINAFTELHFKGYAHSVEIWKDEKLVGGLYGMAIGKIFFGESMFSNVSNASKYGFIFLVRKLQKLGIQVIDCQQETDHLKSLGARVISKELFWKHIKTNLLHEERVEIV